VTPAPPRLEGDVSEGVLLESQQASAGGMHLITRPPLWKPGVTFVRHLGLRDDLFIESKRQPPGVTGNPRSNS